MTAWGAGSFDPDRLHRPVLQDRRTDMCLQMGRFCGDFRRIITAIAVSTSAWRPLRGRIRWLCLRT